MVKAIFRPWVLTALAAVAAYLLQVFALTGIFLMMVGAILWPGVLLHITMVLLAIDCWRGKTWRGLAVVPVAFYVFGLGAWALSHYDARSLARHLAAMDEGGEIAYDPNTQVVFFGAGHSARTAAPFRELQGRYKLDLVFVQDTDADGVIANHVLPLEECPEENHTAHAWRTGFHVDHVTIDNACMFSVPQQPDRPPIVISTSTRERRWGFATARITRTEVRSGVQVTTLHTAETHVYPPIPMLIAGCALDSGEASWECVTALMPMAHRVGGDRTDRLAETIGLSRRTLRMTSGDSGAFDQASAEIDFAPDPRRGDVRRYVSSFANGRLETFFAELPDVIAGRGEFSVDDPWNLATASPERNAENIELLLGGLESLEATPRTRQVRWNLTRALIVLPEDAWLAQRQRILRLAANRDSYLVEEGLLIRLGDYGAEAVPILLAELQRTDHGSVSTAAAFGLCRAGIEANTPDVRSALSRPWPVGAVAAQGAFLALLRMGDREGATRVRLDDRWREQLPQWREEQLATVTPHSPRTVCRPHRRYPTTALLPPDMRR